MKKLILFCALCGMIATPATSQTFKDLKKRVEKSVTGSGSSGLSQEEVGKGLKEALNRGIEKGVDQLSKRDGYFKDPSIKIPLPSEAKTVESSLRKLGQGDKVDKAVESMNRAAEDAAQSAKQLFVEAIQKMTIDDAMSILNGNDDAATKYLDKSTRSSLITKFKPSIKTSLDKVDATKHWETVFNSYNKIPMVKKVNPDLVSYVTGKAIDGLFVQIAKEELEIRKNPEARVTDLLKKVFGQ